MVNQARSRKRVRALRRAPDGSAFQNCDECGASVAVALMDMHDCQLKKGVKKVKGICEKAVVNKNTNFSQEPRSAFQFFLESYTKTCSDGDMIDINRQAFEKWKTMSFQERLPYRLQEEKVERAHMKALRQEVEQMSQEDDDEADSAMVGKFSKEHDYFEHSGSYHCYWSEEWDYGNHNRFETSHWIF